MNKSMEKVVTELREKATRFNTPEDGKFYITKDEVSFGEKHEDTTMYTVEAYSEDLNATTLIGGGQIKGWNLSDKECFKDFTASV